MTRTKSGKAVGPDDACGGTEASRRGDNRVFDWVIQQES